MTRKSFSFRAAILLFTLAVISCNGKNKENGAVPTTPPVSQTKDSNINEGGVNKMSLARKPAVAGAFYPSNPIELKQMIKEFFDETTLSEESGALLGLIAPHAGYVYSGGVAAYSYKAIKNPDEIETIILLGPSHRAAFNGISVYPSGAFATPLGNVAIDEEAAKELIDQNSGIAYIEQAHTAEHSLEVQLPFIQTVFKNVKIFPVVFGSYNQKTYEKFVEKIVEIAKKKKILLIASTDFSHYHDYKTAVRMDNLGIDSILKLSSDELMKKNMKGDSELCGIYPTFVLINIMNKLGANKATLLKYANSGDVTGDKSQVVGYASVAFYKSEGSLKEAELSEDKNSDELSKEEKKTLLKIARDTVREYIRNKKRLAPNDIADPKLLVKNGAFVTIKERAELRGCIGTFTSDQPLYETIISMAISAATEDPRFPPIVADELNNLDFEISVLSPLRKIKDVNEIEVGKHGIYIIKGRNRGVLLPQVATEYNWDRLTFLEQTCRKAGLPKDAWKEKADIYIFDAQVFSYEDVK